MAFKPFTFSTPAGIRYTLVLDDELADGYNKATRESGLLSDVARLLLGLLKPGDVFFDIGANVGTVAVPMAASAAVVHAFDIVPANQESLERAAVIATQNLHVCKAAVLDVNGETSFSGEGPYASVVSDSDNKTKAIRLDTYVAEQGVRKIDLIKIDIEGSELMALHGMADVLTKHKPNIIFESNVWTCGVAGYTYRGILSYLELRGYRIYRMLGQKLFPAAINGFQDCVCCDYLATTADISHLLASTDFSPAEPSNTEIIDSFLANAMDSDITKQYAIEVIAHCSAQFTEFPQVSNLVRKLKSEQRDPKIRKVLRIGLGTLLLDPKVYT